MSDRHIPVDINTVKSLIGEGIHTGLRKGSEAPSSTMIWSAISDSDDGAWDDALNFCLRSLESVGYRLFKVEPDFVCPAYIAYGPGHRIMCESRTPHPIEGDHWARDPLCPDLEWTGPEASA